MSDEIDAPPKKSKTLVMAIAAVALLGCGGGAAYWFMRAPATGVSAHEVLGRGLIPFDPFIVNLADSSGTRFLRVTLQLVVATEKEAGKVVEEPVMGKRARSAILELLALQTSDKLVTDEGKQALKKAIVERATTALGMKVSDVFFSEFVVQF